MTSREMAMVAMVAMVGLALLDILTQIAIETKRPIVLCVLPGGKLATSTVGNGQNEGTEIKNG